jgi:hypothetical protein
MVRNGVASVDGCGVKLFERIATLSLSSSLSTCSKIGLGKSFADGFLDALDLLWSKQAALDATAHAVQKLQPVRQWRLFQLLPLIETPLAGVKNPPIANVTGVHLKFLTLLRIADPTDFSFGHVRMVPKV